MEQIGLWWWVGGGFVLLILVALVIRWLYLLGHAVHVERCRELFRLQHERFEEQLLKAAKRDRATARAAVGRVLYYWRRGSGARHSHRRHRGAGARSDRL